MTHQNDHVRDLMGMIMQAMGQDNTRLSEDDISRMPVVPHEGEDQQCAICLNDITNGQEVTKLSCDHVFHADCVQTWFRRSTSCPVCRTDQSRTSEPVPNRRFRLSNNVCFTFQWNGVSIPTAWSLQNHTLADVMDFVARLDGVDNVFQIQSDTLTFKNTEGYNTLKKTLNRTGITSDMTFRVTNHPNIVVFDII